MGVDLLDIVYRLERKYTIRIDREDFTGPMEEWEEAAKAGREAQQELQDRYVDRLTVRFLCDLVEQKIREQNEGKSDFPDVLAEMRTSVRKELAPLFGIDDPASIEDETTLQRLAEKSVPNRSGRFWRRFYEARSADPPELKTIKKQIRATQLVPGCMTLGLSICLTALILIVYWIVCQFVALNVSGMVIVTVLVTIWVILFGRQVIVNHLRKRRPPNLTVGELIELLAEERPDRSVRADGFPYSREDIERGVAEALCEALGIEPEDVSPEARIYKDLGAE